MKAVVWTAYGSPKVLRLGDVDKPTPKSNEVLIRVHAATVTTGDCELRSVNPATWSGLGVAMRIYFGMRKPKRVTILGQELAGEIEAVGSQVTRFKPGDQVLSTCFLHMGAYAEYDCLSESLPVLKPANITYEQAATIPTGGINGLHFLRVANVQAGQSLLINGAGGSIGTFAVQIAKTLGADVTAVDSAEKLDMLRSIGADHVVDFAQEDFTRSGETFDAIIDVIGKSSFSRSVKSLKPNGRYVLGNPSLTARLRAEWTPMSAGKRVLVALAPHRAEYYATLLSLIGAGKIKPVIDRRYRLEQTAEAHAYVDAGHKKGNVLIIIPHPTSA